MFVRARAGAPRSRDPRRLSSKWMFLGCRATRRSPGLSTDDWSTGVTRVSPRPLVGTGIYSMRW